MDENFNLLTRGSVILRWSPSGALDRWVVLSTVTSTDNHNYVRVAQLTETNELRLDNSEFDVEAIEEDEGFGYTFTYMLGDVFHLPEYVL